MLREGSHVHSDANQHSVDGPAVDDSGDDQNDDQAEGGSLLDERVNLTSMMVLVQSHRSLDS